MDMAIAVVPEITLTEKQVAILQWIAYGKRNEDIAQIMGLSSAHAVQLHVGKIMKRLDVESRSAAVSWAQRHKIII